MSVRRLFWKKLFLPVIAFGGRGVAADPFVVDGAVGLYLVIISTSIFRKVCEIGKGTAGGDDLDPPISTIFAGAAVNGVTGGSVDCIPGQQQVLFVVG